MEKMRKLPKNIRQIGEREEKIKIYMEDYVSTYIHKLKLWDDGRPRVGILLGEFDTIEEIPHAFLWGAIEAPGIFEAGEPLSFHELVWTSLYEKKDMYFPKEAICGWFFCIRGEDNLSMELLQRAHRENFMQDQLLFVWQEGENDRFYSVVDRHLKSMKGYSIYYEKNESMQEYLISTNQKKRVEPVQKEPVVQNFRSIMEKKKQHKKKKFRYAYSAGVAALILGIATISGIKTLPVLTGQVIVETRQETEEATEAMGIVEEIPGNVFPTEMPVTAPVEEPPTVAPPQTEPPTTAPPTTVSSTEVQSELQIYTVQAGDTLSTISQKVYQNNTMISKICEVNNITDPDILYPGQQLKMP